MRAAGIVLAALSVQEFWGHVFFNLVALPLPRAETAVVGMMLETARAGTVWQDNVITGPNGFGIMIYTGCSSFYNPSLAMLCWFTVSRFRNQNWQIRDFMVGSVVGGTIILLNIARLFLMTWDIDLFHYWPARMSITARRSVACLSRLPDPLRRLSAMERTIGTMSTGRSASVIRMQRSLCCATRSSAVPSATAKGAPTRRDRHLQLIA
jgi:hypothetical protein